MNPEIPHTWPRLFVNHPLAAGLEAEISPESTHYLMNVLRAKAGDPVRLFNGKDGEWLARLAQPPKNKKSGVKLLIDSQRCPQKAEPDVWLCAAPIKKNHFDYMIQKATELGVSCIQPVLTARTQIRDSNTERLRAIAIEAAEQSERLTVPVIKESVTLSKLVESWPQDRSLLLCAEFGQAETMASALPSMSGGAAIFVGPEGGYTEEEMKLIQNVPNMKSLRLGPRILRADTAAIAALSVWQTLCGDWKDETETQRV